MRIHEITEAPETNNKIAGAPPNQYSVDAKGNYTPLNKAPQPKMQNKPKTKSRSFTDIMKGVQDFFVDPNKPKPKPTGQMARNIKKPGQSVAKLDDPTTKIPQKGVNTDPNRFAGVDGGVQPKAKPKQFKKLDKMEPLGPPLDRGRQQIKPVKTEPIPTPTPRPKTIKPSAPKKQGRVTYRTLARLSGIKDPNKIFPGQKVTLPGGGSYTVKKGDTLSGIAQTYRLSQQAKRNNPKVDV
jgi:LysM repeat protein